MVVRLRLRVWEGPLGVRLSIVEALIQRAFWLCDGRVLSRRLDIWSNDFECPSSK